MGRFKFSIRKGSFLRTLLGGFILFMGIMLGKIMIDGFSAKDAMWFVYGLFVLIPIIFGLYFTLTGLLGVINPGKSSYARNYPGLMQLAEEHFSNIVYKDKFITLSKQAISSNKHPRELRRLEDVYYLYVEATHVNVTSVDIPVLSDIIFDKVAFTKHLMIQTADGDIALNINGRKKDDVRALQETITIYCPQAKFMVGKYVHYKELNAKRKEWRKTHPKEKLF